MKKILFILLLGLSLQTQAGGFVFPNVPFEYAKLYLFNINLEQPNHMGFRIYNDGVYAKSKLGNGVKLSEEFHQKVIKNFAKGMDELIIGLGKCYMPRHGIIYYDKNHVPVASMSICFECDRITVWSKTPITFNEDYTKFNYDKAENQMARLAKIIEAENIPVYTRESDVNKYNDYLNSDTLFTRVKKVKINESHELDVFGDTIRKETVINWLYKKSRLKFTETTDTVGNTNGGVNVYTLLKIGNKSQISFIDGQLIDCRIYHQDLLFPLNISVGMSVEEVYQKLGYTQPEQGYPSSLEIDGFDWLLRLEFKYQTLNYISLKNH